MQAACCSLQSRKSPEFFGWFLHSSNSSLQWAWQRSMVGLRQATARRTSARGVAKANVLTIILFRFIWSENDLDVRQGVNISYTRRQ